MAGFFMERANPQATANNTSNKKNRKPTCLTCGLKGGCKTKRMQPIGNPDGKVLVIWGTVSEQEDYNGCMQESDQIMKLKRALKQNGINHRDVAFVRAVRCHADKVTEKEIISCSEHHYKLITNHNFTNIILVGKQAVISYFSYQNNKHATYQKLRGLTVPDTTFKCFVSVVQEPSSDPRSRYDSDVIMATLFLNDIKSMSQYYGKQPPDAYTKIREFLTPCNEEQAIVEMKKVLEFKFKTFIAFDYETTGLRPYNRGHKILSVGIATSKRECFSFILTPKTIPYLKKILRSTHIPKVAANIKFEKTWTMVLLKCTINNWLLDTVLSAHILDNRPGITSVKFQAFLLFGIYGYEDAVKQYISSSKEDEKALGANAFNTMAQLPDNIMLEYVAMDALLEYWIAIKHMDTPNMELV